jgi:hypothetical protein
MRNNARSITLRGIEQVYRNEVQSCGGKVFGRTRDAKQFMARAVYQGFVDVRPNDPNVPRLERDRRTGNVVSLRANVQDHVKKGVAIRATTHDVLIAPYVFRQICRNGAILSRMLATRHISLSELSGRAEAEYVLRDAIRASSQEETFANAADQLRAAHEQPGNLRALQTAILTDFAPPTGALTLGLIHRQLMPGVRPTQFMLINAVTAVARDVTAPHLKWRLEELGGGMILTETGPPPRSDDGETAIPLPTVSVSAAVNRRQAGTCPRCL